MLRHRWFENSRGDGIPVLEIQIKEETTPRFIPLQKTDLKGTITGPFGHFFLTQTFLLSRELCSHPVEAIYRFPLPGDCAVLGVSATFGQTHIQTTLKARDEAEKEYAKAKEQKKAALLTTRESPDVFTLYLAGLVPDEKVLVTTEYIEMGHPESSGFSFRIPLTIAPRFVREDEQYSRHAQGQPLALLRDPQHRFSLSLVKTVSGDITSPTHLLTVSGEDLISLKDKEIVPDRDCILVWNPPLQVDQSTLQVFTDSSAGEYLLALVTPPAKSPRILPRDVILLVDHSGSMMGPKRAAADWAVKRFLQGLSPQDVFNLCLFESTTHWFSERPVSATPKSIAAATTYLQDEDMGGTNLGMAIEQALIQPRRTGDVSRHLIILTDAQVTDSGRILQLIRQEEKQIDRRRISILCIDSAPNAYLVQQITEIGRGVVKFLTSSPQEEDINSALDSILAEWKAPVLVDATLQVNRTILHADRKKVQLIPGGSQIDLGDISTGKTVWIPLRCTPSSEPLAITLIGKGIPEPIRITSAHEERSIKALYGARLINLLESLMHSNYELSELDEELEHLHLSSVPDQIKKTCYFENKQQGITKFLKNTLVQESLSYGIPSSETAFIAIIQDTERKVEQVVPIANALPNGWSEDFLKESKLVIVGCGGAGPSTMSHSYRVTLSSRTQDWKSGGLIDFIGPGGGGYSPEPRHRNSSATGKDIPKDWISRVFGPPMILPTHPEEQRCVFSGIPQFIKGEAILFDTAQDDQKDILPRDVTFHRIEVDIPDPRKWENREAAILIYVKDMMVPRFTIPIQSLLVSLGRRSIRINRFFGTQVKITLIDPTGTWEKNSIPLKVVLYWPTTR